MRLWSMCAFFSTALWAQLPANSPLVRGVLLERDPQTTSGEFSVRREDNHVLRYRFDPKTYVERDKQLIDVSRLEPGEKIEVVSDEGSESSLRYARTVHVLESAPPAARAVSQGRFRAYRAPIEHPLPTSTLSYSGVVFRVNESRVMVHTREAGDQTILLRQDTRYLDNGAAVDVAALKPNMRIFVKAGRNLYDDVEAYQIIWGHILMPRE